MFGATLLRTWAYNIPRASVLCVAATLFGRTLMSLWIARNMGQCVEAFCNKRWDDLKSHISSFGSVTLGAALLNALLKYFVNVTALDVRQRLTRSVHQSYVRKATGGKHAPACNSKECPHPLCGRRYMSNMAYYQANKVADANGVIENADQLIADDIDKFSDTLADVFRSVPSYAGGVWLPVCARNHGRLAAARVLQQLAEAHHRLCAVQRANGDHDGSVGPARHVLVVCGRHRHQHQGAHARRHQLCAYEWHARHQPALASTFASRCSQRTVAWQSKSSASKAASVPPTPT